MFWETAKDHVEVSLNTKHVRLIIIDHNLLQICCLGWKLTRFCNTALITLILNRYAAKMIIWMVYFLCVQPNRTAHGKVNIEFNV